MLHHRLELLRLPSHARSLSVMASSFLPSHGRPQQVHILSFHGQTRPHTSSSVCETIEDRGLSSSTETASMALPQAFLNFLYKNGVDPAVYSAASSLPRYIRLKPGCEDDVEEVEAELGVKFSPVTWLQNFFSLSQEAHLANTKAYKLGKLYGMDAASGAAVAALDILCSDHVLDLCAAPGAKLCMIADLLGASGTLTGVDISRHRLAACRTMLLKYGNSKNCRLFLADGTTFSLLPQPSLKADYPENGNIIIESQLAESHSHPDNIESSGVLRYGEWTSRRTSKEKRAARRLRWKNKARGSSENEGPELFFYGVGSGVVGLTREQVFGNACTDRTHSARLGYDKVLVDAECTHDGSLKHVRKYESWGWDTFERRVLDEDRINSLTALQKSLLCNGFRLLKVGGILVYSTCSFTRAQNEEVVENFLAEHPNAELKEIELASKSEWPCKSGNLIHTLRFDPLTSNTSGLFIAKITKH